MRLLSFLLIILCFSCSNKEKKYYEVVRENLNGNVQSVKYEDYGTNFLGQKLDKIPFSKGIIEYDKNGKLSEYTSKLHDEIPIIEKYKYDDKGNLIELKIYYDTSLDVTYKFIYDKKGNLIEKSEFNSIGTRVNRNNYEYKFDNKGNWITKTIYKQGLEDTKRNNRNN